MCFVTEIKSDVNLYIKLGVVPGAHSCHSMSLSTSHYLIYGQQWGWMKSYLFNLCW